MKTIEKRYIDIYTQNSSRIVEHGATLFNHKRDDYFQKFVTHGFPTYEQENYKYTNLTKALEKEYVLGFENLSKNSLQQTANTQQCNISDMLSYRYLLHNGSCIDERTNRKNPPLPEGVIVESMKSASKKYPSLIEKYYGRLSDKQQDAMIDFNGAFVQDGLFVYIPKNISVEHPICLINQFEGDKQCMINTRHLIVVEQGAKLQMVAYDYTPNDTTFLLNTVTEVFVGENAFYEHYQLENVNKSTTNLSSVLMSQSFSSNVLGNVITLHNGTSRNNIAIELEGENCETMLCGLFFGTDEQRIDNFTSIVHGKPHCHSTELFKHVLDNSSQGGFTGKLYVAPDAQKTQAYQTNKNIVLKGTAKARTRPQLEIYADDVKCSHGATIGQLDDSAMFYMRSRGIPILEAKMLLMNAFLSDVIEQVRIEPLRVEIAKLIEKRFRDEATS